MRIYVSVDMEGLAGVAHPHQVVHGREGIDRADYDRSRALMAGEANAAIEAAFEHGADYAAVLPGTERLGPRTVGFTAEDGDAFYRTFLSLNRLASVPVV